MSNKSNRAQRTTGALQRLVGISGEFTNSKGKTCQCVVTGAIEHCKALKINYVHPNGHKVTDAYIAEAEFRPISPTAR